MINLIRLFRMVILMVFVILSFSCCHKNPPKTSSALQGLRQPSIAEIRSPESETVLNWGDSVKIEMVFNSSNATIDSMRIVSNNSGFETYTGNFENIYWHTEKCRVGQNTARLMIYYNDTLIESHTFSVVLRSDMIPVNYSYSVVGSYPHDEAAYTQGLFFHNGYLYESTGGYDGSSSLRIVDILSGKPEKIISMKDPDIFAEGITPYHDLIFQVTYKSKIGFVYQLNDLEMIRSFDYQISEGWGLTSDTKNLIMSDGSQYLYIFEPEFFTQTDQMEVFDNKGMVKSLNEMEYVNGKILANIYGETYIVVIDMATGRVTGRLDLDNLMPDGFRGDMAKVLNGIAYNPENEHLYITGKHWPVLYEIIVDPSL